MWFTFLHNIPCQLSICISSELGFTLGEQLSLVIRSKEFVAMVVADTLTEISIMSGGGGGVVQ